MNYKNKNKITVISTIVAFMFVFNLNFALASEITPENIIDQVNKERVTRDLAPLETNEQLENAAYNKSIDMITRNYFEHYAHGLTPWSFIIAQGYDYTVAGENLAMGFDSSEGVVNAWMNSPAHRANILNPEFEEIGVGVVKGEYTENNQKMYTTMTTELLARPKPRVIQIFETIVETFSRIFNR